MFVLQALGRATEGFSGSDVSTVVKDVLMQPIRILRDATHFRKVGSAVQHQQQRNELQPLAVLTLVLCTCNNSSICPPVRSAQQSVARCTRRGVSQ